MDRRTFLTAAGVASAAVGFTASAVERAQAAAASAPSDPALAAQDEDFWFHIRHAFTVDRGLVNLNNGGCSPAPRVTQQAMNRYLEMQNMAPVYYMWRQLDPEVETVRRRLAEDFGCDPEELAITRNASESLEILQYGLDLAPGDEIVTTDQDYPRMITAWKQRERRDGVVLKQVSFEVPLPSTEYFVRRIEQALSDRTRVIMICHITNRTGQILPVREVCRLGRERGVEVMIDGAHSYAHFPFTRDELDCDYFGTSLHKWLLAPIGTGFLYIRREKIPKIWPLMGAPASQDDDIRKFEQIGTHPAANRLATAESLVFHHSIGAERKAARLRYLRERWSRRLSAIPGVGALTPYDPAGACGIGLLTVEDYPAPKLVQALWREYRILATPIIQKDQYEGVRVTPNVYTTLDEIDFFGDAVEELIRKRRSG